MSAALCFWILMLLAFVIEAVGHWPINPSNIRPLGISLILFLILMLLGWRVFGPAIHG